MALFAVKMVLQIDWVTQAFILIIFSYLGWGMTASISCSFLKKLLHTTSYQGHLHVPSFDKIKSSVKINLG